MNLNGYQGNFQPSVPAVIAQGAQLSSPIKCNGFSLVGILLPSVFTGTALTFQVGDSVDGFQARGQATFSTNPADSDTITINGTVITFVTGTPSGSQVKIGTLLSDTLVNLLAFLLASTDTGIAACSYAVSGSVLTVVALVHGVAGNAYTFDKSSSAITLVPSGGTLSGGGFRDLYDGSNSLISMTVAQNRAYAVDPKNFQGLYFLVIKSGTTEVASRTIICQLKGF